MTAKVRVEENLKGKSEFQEIRINIATGHGNFPQKMIQKFAVGLPAIIFCQKEGLRIPSLGHVNGAWFQTDARDQSDKGHVWWNFSHIESEPLNGVERWGRSDFQATPSAGELFGVPNKLRSGEVFIDDTWTGWNGKFTVLATTNDGKEIVVAMLGYRKGMYLITSFKNETSANISINHPIMEKLIHFAVKWLTK